MILVFYLHYVVAANCQQKRHRLQTFREGAERAGRNLEPELKEEFRQVHVMFLFIGFTEGITDL